jgi:hypothetical protein
MAIHTKVGILSQIPGASASVTPGLIDGLYADFLTKEFDFLDDSLMYPQDEWFTADPMTYIGSGDWEDVGTNYRQWRDNRYYREKDYWLQRQYRIHINPSNFVQDPASYSNNGNGSNAFEFIRLVYPAPNLEFNIPYPNPRGSENYSFYNSSRPLKHLNIRLTLPLIDMASKLGFASGSEDCLENQSWVDGQAPDTMSMRNSKHRQTKEQLFQILGDVETGATLFEDVESDIAAKREEILNFDYEANNPNPWSDERYRFMWGDGVNPVEGAQNTTIHQLNGGEGNSYLTNHPLGTMPFEVLPGVTMSNILPSISQISKAPAVGNPGDIIILSDGTRYAWDPQNQEWSTGFYYRFLHVFMNRMDSIRDAKLKAVEELSFACRPFTFAALHIPAFSLSANGEVVK